MRLVPIDPSVRVRGILTLDNIGPGRLCSISGGTQLASLFPFVVLGDKVKGIDLPGNDTDRNRRGQ